MEVLVPIAKQWLEESSSEKFGLDSQFDKGMNDLKGLAEGSYSARSALFLLEDNGQCVGFMGIRSFDSPLGKDRIAEEHYLYVVPEHRGRGGLVLLKVAKAWAKENMCSHIVLNASKMASSGYSRVCNLYERMGFQEFEKSYIMTL